MLMNKAETPNEETTTDKPVNEAVADKAQTTTEQTTPAPEFKVARPDHIPEKFWDAEKGAARTDDLVKSYTELEKALTKAKEKPKAPEAYDYKVPEALVKEFELQETIPADDPYLTKFNEFAKENGMSQEEYSKFMDFYMDMEVKQKFSTIEGEFKKLGDNGQARLTTIKKFAGQYLTEKSQAALINSIQSAENVELVEELMSLVSKGRAPADEDTRIEAGLTDVQLRALMKTEAYWDKNHADHKTVQKKVADGFASLEKGK